METLLVYLALGIAAGLIAGLFGVGGGLIIVPVLALSYTAQGMPEAVVMHMALGTSLATIVVTSLSSVRAHHRAGNVPWAIIGPMLPAIAAGALAGAMVAHLIPSLWLQRGFGVFALLFSVYMWRGSSPAASRRLPGTPGLLTAGGSIGVFSALAGIGGGSLTVPFLSWCSVPIHRAVGAGAAGGLPIAVAGAAGYMLAGWHLEGLPAWSAGYVYWPAFAGISVATVLMAPVGARLATALPAAVLRRLFSLLLAVLGVVMLVQN